MTKRTIHEGAVFSVEKMEYRATRELRIGIIETGGSSDGCIAEFLEESLAKIHSSKGAMSTTEAAINDLVERTITHYIERRSGLPTEFVCVGPASRPAVVMDSVQAHDIIHN